MAGLDVEWLDDFLEVAEKRNFTFAAEARGLSPSTLSRRIQSLEQWLGPKLLKRETAPLELTEAGGVFRAAAERIVVSLRDAKYKTKQIAEQQTTRIYTLHTLSATFIPLVIRELKEKLHDDQMEIRTSVIAGNISDCVEAIAYGAAPFMVSYENEKHRILFSEETLGVLYPQDEPHVRREKIRSIRIAKDRLIPVCAKKTYDRYEKMLRAGTPIPYSTYSPGTYLSELVKAKVDDLELDQKIKLKPVHDAQMADTLRNLVREGQGIAWVLLSTAQRALEAPDELQRFDFNLGHEPNIDLDIKLFRAADFNDPTADRIWGIADTLEKALTPRDFI